MKSMKEVAYEVLEKSSTPEPVRSLFAEVLDISNPTLVAAVRETEEKSSKVESEYPPIEEAIFAEPFTKPRSEKEKRIEDAKANFASGTVVSVCKWSGAISEITPNGYNCPSCPRFVV